MAKNQTKSFTIADQEQELPLAFSTIRESDSIVRAEHRAWHGKKFRYSAPPDGTLPGIPPRCRCFAVPVIPDYLPMIGETRVFDPRSDPTPLGADPLGWLQ